MIKARAQEELSLVFAGHVDHGKSTIIGRLLADTHSLPSGKLEAVRESCRRNSRPFEYAFLLDALKDEQSQGITIDIARCFFKTRKRNYMIIDAPGHIEFLKNMITGAARADAALLVIDACEGIQENSRRHGFMLSMLGIQQICILVNKMDLVNYDCHKFDEICAEYSLFLDKIKVKTTGVIPVSGREGDNISFASEQMPWYSGPTFLEQLDLFAAKPVAEHQPLRLPVQDVYKFTANHDDRRIIAGQIETGSLQVGQEIIFYPSGKSSTIKTIETLNNAYPQSLDAGWSAGLTLSEQIYVRRGEIAARAGEKIPHTTTRLRASLFWLGKQPLRVGKKYLLKLGTARVEMQIESILRVLDASNLDARNTGQVLCNDVAECIVKLDQTLAFDTAEEIPETGRFVIVDQFEISGGGVVLEALEDDQARVRSQAQQRDYHWEKQSITEEDRGERYGQKSCLVLITGSPEDTFRKDLARRLETRLFLEGRYVYYLGMANLLYGVDADIRASGEEVHSEHIRRLAEIANLMMDAGVILIVSARAISQKDIRILENDLIDHADRIITVWVGEEISTDLVPQIYFKQPHLAGSEEEVKHFLQSAGYIH